MRQDDTSITVETVQSNTKRQRILLDTDIGDDIDDALALAIALHSPEIELLGITTVFGDTQLRAQLAWHLLSIFGREDIPIAIGVGKPLQPRHSHQQHQPPSGVAQAAILGDKRYDEQVFSTYSGPELIVQQALAHAGELVLVCIGPLTNMALALLIEPRIATSIRKIVMMGGSSGMPMPEWNVRNDVKAAHIVMSSGIPITQLGMNVTRHCQLRKQDIEKLRKATAQEAQLLYKLVTIWQQHRKRWHPSLPYLHDPLAMLALCAPELLRLKDRRVRLVEHGLLRGCMMADRNGDLPVHAAIGVQVREAREWVMQRLLAEKA